MIHTTGRPTRNTLAIFTSTCDSLHHELVQDHLPTDHSWCWQ